MEDFVDHYIVLGLSSGEEALKLTEKEIAKAYKLKALDLHPDKRPDDPYAHEKFQRLKTSYDVLKDEKSRNLFDGLLRIQLEKQQKKKSQVDSSKRRKMMSDLEQRERSAAFSPDLGARSLDEEERIAKKLKEEIESIRAGIRASASIRARHAKKKSSVFETHVDEKRKEERSSGGASVPLDKEKILKVSWETFGEGYTAGRLREVFSEFGEVEDVVIRITKKKSSALIVMATKDAAIAATRTMCGHLSNPLLVLPLQKAAQSYFVTAKKTGYQAYEDAVMQRLRKAGGYETRNEEGLSQKI